jgi:alkanesulfonate monooxygenase SsuD/methylene tetrahydromethanopterin reductase-like flavin-dependent oxidoreductase (luciferase family)
MDVGVCMASKIDEVDDALVAEEQGYTDFWVADSPMLWSDCYAVMALVAARTTRIRIGTGVAVAGIRPAPVTAAALATINRLAPGRVFCGIGTGNTAMRLLGQKPIGLGEFERHLRELRSLLDGEETELSWRGAVAPTRHLMPDTGFVAFQPPIPLYVSAFGPKATAVAARVGDGIVVSVPPTPEGVARVRDRVAAAAAVAGHTLPEPFPITTLTTAVVLDEGEPRDSARVREESGAFAISALHYAYEQWRQYGRRPPPMVRDVWEDYVAELEAVPDERRHLRIHQGHNCWVEPSEARFLTPALIDATCLVGTAAELAARLRELEAAGLTQVMLLPPLAVKRDVLERFAREVLPRVR